MADAPTLFHLQPISTRVGPLALVTMDNGEDWQQPNVFGRAALESLHALLPRLRAPGWQGLVITGKPFGFAAGADLTEFPHLTEPELAREAARAGHDAFLGVRTLPFPTLAAVNGAAVGGGLELALHCDFRTIARSVRHVGFPEVFLGIVPAWGGTQLAPRLVGPAKAIELIVANPLRQNRLLGAAEVVEIGLADELVDDVEFLDDSIAWLVRAIEDRRPPKPAADLSSTGDACAKARYVVDDAVHRAALAPYRALDLIAGAAAWTLDEGYAAEEDALADLLPGPQAQAGVYAFDVVERRVKRGIGIPGARPRPVRRVGVVGAGLMATQIATLFLRRLETPVLITDVDAARVEEAVAAIRGELRRQVERGRLAESKAGFLASVVTGASGTEAFGGCDLVIEAVFEELTVKERVLAALESVVSDECLLVTNTSSLSVAAMSAGLRRPERVVGMHFFNPVAVLPLIELVRAPATDDVTLATAWDVSKKLGKRGVLVEDAPGFVVNRLLTRQSSVLMQALEQGNTLEETDEAALKLGIPMPPSALLAMVGPRVANQVLHTLHEAFPERFPLSPTLERFAQGEMDIVRTGAGRRTVDEIHAAILDALADECRHLLDERVVGSAAEIDACMILGAGYPFFRGGITKHLDQTGVAQRMSGRPLGNP